MICRRRHCGRGELIAEGKGSCMLDYLICIYVYIYIYMYFQRLFSNSEGGLLGFPGIFLKHLLWPSIGFIEIVSVEKKNVWKDY